MMLNAHRPLHVLYSFPSRFGVPGTGTTAWHQVAGLLEVGVRVTLICGSCERPLPGNPRVIETMKAGGLKIPYRLVGRLRAFKWHDRVVARFLRSSAGQIDIVHCWPLGSLQTLAAARDAGAVSFLERPNCHTAFAYEIVAQECRKLGLLLPRKHSHSFNKVYLSREQDEYDAADRLMCPSDFVARTFLERGFAPQKLLRHQYGFDPNRFRLAGPTPLARDANRPLTAVFVGSGEPRKGLHYLLDAWFKSGASEHGLLHIVGAFVPEYRSLLAQKLAHPSIRVAGFVSDVERLIQSCDVLVLPSIEEGSALVTYEGRACGCVLLVSDAAGAHCVHMVDGLVHEAGRSDVLADHIRSLLNDRALLERLRAASIAGIDQLTWASAATKLRDLYLDALPAAPDASFPSHAQEELSLKEQLA